MRSLLQTLEKAYDNLVDTEFTVRPQWRLPH